MNYPENYLKSALFEFRRYKTLGERTFAQLSENELHRKHSKNDNSIALIVKHMVGNMLSRWTNFLTEDGEKAWRNREEEFESPYTTKDNMLVAWENGWQCLFEALESVNATNFDTIIKISGEDHTIIEATNRQLAHYANHVGQIVLLGKMIKGAEWVSLSIPKGGSSNFNETMFKKS